MKIRVYISCHDDTSERRAKRLIEEWKLPSQDTRVVRFGAFPMMENQIFDHLDKNPADWEWESADVDYVCLLTYKILDKLTDFSRGKCIYDWQDVVDAVEETHPDVMSLCMMEFKKVTTPPPPRSSEHARSVPSDTGDTSTSDVEERRRQMSPMPSMPPMPPIPAPLLSENVSVVRAAVFSHGLSFFLAWDRLLQGVGFSREEDRRSETIRRMMCCNWWLAKPAHLRAYISFYKRCVRRVCEDPGLYDLMMENAYYHGNMTEESKRRIFHGRPFYTVLPFVFERLPTFFFCRSRVNVRPVSRWPILVMRV